MLASAQANTILLNAIDKNLDPESEDPRKFLKWNKRMNPTLKWETVCAQDKHEQ